MSSTQSKSKIWWFEEFFFKSKTFDYKWVFKWIPCKIHWFWQRRLFQNSNSQSTELNRRKNKNILKIKDLLSLSSERIGSGHPQEMLRRQLLRILLSPWAIILLNIELPNQSDVDPTDMLTNRTNSNSYGTQPWRSAFLSIGLVVSQARFWSRKAALDGSIKISNWNPISKKNLFNYQYFLF